jgi:protein-tyrosine phosphatase
VPSLLKSYRLQRKDNQTHNQTITNELYTHGDQMIFNLLLSLDCSFFLTKKHAAASIEAECIKVRLCFCCSQIIFLVFGEGKERMSYSDDFSFIHGYELFNRLNHTEPLIPIQFLKSSTRVEEFQLRGGVVILIPEDNAQISFQKYAERILPFLLKTSENYKKVLRRYVLLFESSSVSDDLSSNILSQFHEFILTSKGRIVLTDLEHDSESLSAENIDFTCKVSVLKDPFQQFHEKYAKCYSIYEWSRFVALGKVYHDYYATEILDNFLFLGDYLNASSKDQLLALKITHVVDATNDELSKAVSNELNIQYLPVPVWDVETADISVHFSSVNEFIVSAQQTHQQPRVLIHCRAGWSRSPSLVLAYFLGVLKMPLKEAIVHVVKQRPMVCPNEGFRRQLIRYEKEVLSLSSLSSLSSTTVSSSEEEEKELLAVIHASSRIWSHSSTVETDFDRIPILAFKNKKNEKFLQEEYPVVPSDPVNNENQSGQLSQETTTAVAKPKKSFLKRGTGLNIHKEIAEKKKLLLLQQKKSPRTASSGILPEDLVQQQTVSEEH